MAESARAALEVVLGYSAGRWFARAEGIDLEHSELIELDRLIVRALDAQQHVERAHVRFDTSRLPVWVRQYHTHYCNYVLKVDRRPAGSAPA